MHLTLQDNELSVVECCHSTHTEGVLTFRALYIRGIRQVIILLAGLQVVIKTLETQQVRDPSCDIRLLTVGLQGILRCRPETVGGGIVGKCLKTAVAMGNIEDGRDVHLPASQLTVKLIFDDMSVGLTTYEHGIILWKIADALLIAVRLLVGHKGIGTYILDITGGRIRGDGHQMETRCACLVVDYGIAITSQPCDTAVIAGGHCLGEVMLFVDNCLLGKYMHGKQT